MTTRHILALLALTLVVGVGCNLRHRGLDDSDAGTAPSDGGDGVCCPVPSMGGCSPGESRLGGGWAPTRAECTYTIEGYDVLFEGRVDEHGCTIYVPTGEFCGLFDAGPGFDASVLHPPPDCDGLGEAACLSAGCVPTYHDACCSSCEPGAGCADCIDYQFWSCEALDTACGGGLCSSPTPWACGGEVPDCSLAHPAGGSSSCDVPGCVPAVAAEGFMEPAEACVPVTAQTCTASCMALPPTCPTATSPEADGSCWTGRCIPSSVCGL